MITRTLTNGLKLEIKQFTTFGSMRVVNFQGVVVASHSWQNSNKAYKRQLIKRYEALTMVSTPTK
mgnify:FL=1|tara:strand:- start:67 stop:261 length:195 start_codon:yes stop_codon:yes gene_type:complete